MTASRHVAGERKRPSTSFYHQGKQACMKIFRMLHGIGEKIFKNLTKSLKEDGLAPRIHGNTKRKPNHALSFSSAELHNYTEQNGLLLAASSCGSSRILYAEGLIILNLEFIEMRDLMPEMWMRGDEASACSTLFLPRHKSAPVTDILQWPQRFSAIVGVLSQKFPRMVPQLMAYQAVIIKCSQDFDGLAWAQYDRTYRGLAALRI